MSILKTYKSKSGETAMQIMGDGIALRGAVFRLDSGIWHSVCPTKDFDYDIEDDEINVLLESFDMLIFNLDDSAFCLSSV